VIEQGFFLFVQFFGIAVFTMIQQMAFNIKYDIDTEDLIDKKVQGVEEFIYLIDRSSKFSLHDDIYEGACDYIENSLRHSVLGAFHGEDSFFKELTPQLRKRLVDQVLQK
jgi:hypothetical protein